MDCDVQSAITKVIHSIELGCPKRKDWAFQGLGHHNTREPSHEVQVLRAKLDTARLAIRLARNPLVERSYASKLDKLSLRLKIARIPDARRREILDMARQVEEIKIASRQ